jgi:hypothetical protein
MPNNAKQGNREHAICAPNWLHIKLMNIHSARIDSTMYVRRQMKFNPQAGGKKQEQTASLVPDGLITGDKD